MKYFTLTKNIQTNLMFEEMEKKYSGFVVWTCCTVLVDFDPILGPFDPSVWTSGQDRFGPDHVRSYL